MNVDFEKRELEVLQYAAGAAAKRQRGLLRKELLDVEDKLRVYLLTMSTEWMKKARLVRSEDEV